MEIISCPRSKSLYFKKFKKYGTNHYRNIFNQYRSRSKTLTDKRFRLYINNMQATLSTNPKKFWNCIQQKKGHSRILGIMHYKDITLQKPADIVNGFGHFFKSVYMSANTTPPDTITTDIDDDIIMVISNITSNEVYQPLKLSKNSFTSRADGREVHPSEEISFKRLSYCTD
ncbi:hypothetical protein Zmor_021469 [Zophobas morio]|uniref:Uncharacterized protein n=1 Tax=Zophobas morio TaxID=2755281 RepID=A0AA38MAH7_9CUCU|nr:hypothetical protein Zmor_021469 [Zophobas morio]